MISLLTGSALWSAFGRGFLKRAASHMLSDIEAVWKWLAADLWRLVAAVALIAWGIDHVSCHRHAAHVEKQLASTTKALTDLRAQLTTAAAKIRAQDAQNAAMATQLRKANDEEHRNIDALGGAVLLRGPGAAACPRISAAPAAPIRSQQAAPETGSTVAPVPDTGGTELIALPFAPTVRAFQNGDECFADRRAVDAWYDNLVKAWPKAK